MTNVQSFIKRKMNTFNIPGNLFVFLFLYVVQLIPGCSAYGFPSCATAKRPGLLLGFPCVNCNR